MSRAWYMDDSDADQRTEHHQEPPRFIDLDRLKQKSGVVVYKLNPDTFETDGSYDKIRSDRGYNYEDLLEVSPNTLPDYETKIKNFYCEHIHRDEEIRFIVGGSGYFDVRDDHDCWIRIECLPGDLVVLPAGIYHRFTMDTKNYIKVRRLFIGEPIWTPHNRPADDFKERIGYVNWMKKGFQGENVSAQIF